MNSIEVTRYSQAELSWVSARAATSQWSSSTDLVSRRYADRGYVCRDLSAHIEEGSVIVCSAFEGAATVGTISVRFDSAQGFKAEQVFGPEIHALRASGMSLCEFGRLALDQSLGGNKVLLAHLFHLAYLHAHRLAGCEMLVIEVNPRHVAFYRRMLGFKVLAEERMNLRVMAPAVLMSLDLEYAREQIACFGGDANLAPSTRSLYPYFYDASQEAAMLAKLRQ